MTTLTLPSYRDLDQALAKTALKLHASQVHGLICGIISGHLQGKAAWEELVTGKKESGKTEELLHQLYEASEQQLNEFLFEFQLILPPDSENLPTRAEALTLWAQGFLTGLKLTHVQIMERSPSDMTEAINDLIEIAKMNYEEVVASEEDEAAYVELVEYVRMAVILIYQDLREAEAPNTSKHLH